MFCGKGPNREDCKAGYKCEIDSADRYAVCCPTGKLEEHYKQVVNIFNNIAIQITTNR